MSGEGVMTDGGCASRERMGLFMFNGLMSLFKELLMGR